MRNYDLEFLKRFSVVIGLLSLVTVGLMIGAFLLSKAIPAEVSPVAARQTQTRITPVGAVYAGSTGAAAQAAAAAASAAAQAAQGAYDGTLDGKTIYDQLCTACHTAGVGKAPMLNPAGFGARLAKGKDTLYTHAIEGFNGPDGGVMPPKGGNPGLSEEQIHATVDWMLEQSK